VSEGTGLTSFISNL